MKFKIISMAIFCLLFLTHQNSFAQTLEQAKKHIATFERWIVNFKKYKEESKNGIKVRVINEDFETFYNRADSINKAMPIFSLTNENKQTLKELDNKEPSAFFNKLSDIYDDNPKKMDEAALLMFIGSIRLDYYLNLNPKYAPSNSWTVCQVVKSDYKERLDLYLQNNYDRYIAILKNAIDYCNSNVYAYCKKPTENLTQKMISKPYYELLSSLQNNKSKLIAQWQANKKIKLEPNAVKKQREDAYNEAKKNVEGYDKNIASWQDDIATWTTLVRVLEERKKPNSTILDSLIVERLKYEKIGKISDEDQKRLEEELQKIEADNNPEDTVKVLWSIGAATKNVKDFNDKTDLFEYYNALKKMNDGKSNDLKVNIEILEYINKKNWDNEKKLNVFNLVRNRSEEYFDKLDEMAFGKKIDKTKDVYITKKQKKIRYKIHIRYKDEPGESYMERKNKLLDLLGKTEGWMVWHDCENMYNKSVGAYNH